MINELKSLYQDAELEPDFIGAIRLIESGLFQQVPYVSVPTERAIEAWMRFRSVHEASNRFPTLVPASIADTDNIDPQFLDDPANVIAQAIKVSEDPEWIIRLQDRFDRRHKFGSWTARAHELIDDRGTWPAKVEPRHEFYMPNFFSVNGRVTFLLPECAEPWMMPAALYACQCNDQPDGIMQCAMLRRWYQKWGAQPVCCWGPFYELYVTNPPTNQTDALNLAFEQAWLCYDRISQRGPEIHRLPGHGIEGLAAILLNSSVWYLWWD